MHTACAHTSCAPLMLRAQSSMVEGPAPLDEPLGLAHKPAASEATVELEVHVLDLRRRRLVDPLVDAD
eukprot:1431242-Prymnesium_polylepis.1